MAVLILWIILGPLILIPLIPFMTYQKLYNFQPTHKGSYLLHSCDKKADHSSNSARRHVKFAAILISTPVVFPLAYVSGMLYSLQFMISSCFCSRRS